jgi:glutathione S-transferase
MKLYLNKTSPYARLVLTVAHEKSLAGKLDLVWSDPWASPPELLAVNPYSRVPALVTDDGVAIVDSMCISDYLDGLGNGRPLLPPRGSERARALRKYGLGRGLIDTAFAITIERRFHDAHGELPLADRWMAALGRALESFEKEKGLLSADTAVDLGDLAFAVGLGYTEFRLPEVQWRAAAPRLAAWLDRMAARDSLRATAA